MSEFRVDGVAIVAADGEAVAQAWIDLLGAEPFGVTDELELGCRRTALRLGNGIVDILSPTESGIIGRAYASRGDHLFATSIASREALEVLSEQARAHARKLSDGGLLLTPEALGTTGYLVVRASGPRVHVGKLGPWYESTMLVDDVNASALAIAESLSLDVALFRKIESAEFGYDGILTMFRHGELSRLEVVRPWNDDSTMNRFFQKYGESLYLGFAECEDLVTMGSLLDSMGLDYQEIRRNDRLQQIFVPPAALGGIMLGLAYPDEAWNWSGGELVGQLE